jgi:gamma-glutamyl phosphate reductase
VIYKALICLKSGNAVIFSPHPKAIKSILEAVRIVNDAAVRAGAPEGLISSIKTPTKEATEELMTHKDTT